MRPSLGLSAVWLKETFEIGDKGFFGTELVCRTVEILRQLHADVVRAWLRAPVA